MITNRSQSYLNIKITELQYLNIKQMEYINI